MREMDWPRWRQVVSRACQAMPRATQADRLRRMAVAVCLQRVSLAWLRRASKEELDTFVHRYTCGGPYGQET